MKRRWLIYAEYSDRPREQLNEFPFIGDIAGVMEEATRLIVNPDAVERVECESLGIVSGAMTLVAGAGGMEAQ